jgi:hypothetical protein
MNKSNQVPTKQDCLDAIEYLHVHGVVEEMTTDKKYYVEILLRKVANIYGMVLTNESDEEI